jgi:tetratricopeptide (TPR) repeat protein
VRNGGHLGRRAGTGLFCLSWFAVCLLIGCATPQQKAARHMEQAEHWAKEGKTNEAIVEYRRAIQFDPKSPTAHLALAKIFMERQDYLGTLQQLKNVLNNSPDNHEAQVMMADVLFKGRNFAEAENKAQGLVDKNSNDVDALLILAQSAFAMKDTHLAQTTIDHVLALDPQNGLAWYIKGMLQLVDKRPSDSEASLKNAIQYKPDWIPPVTVLAGLMAQRGDVKGSEQVIREALARNPQNIEAHYLLAAFLIGQSHANEAEDVFRQIKALGENEPANRGVLARYYVVSGKTKAAETEYEEILKSHPDDAQNSRQLAAVYLQLGRTDDAEKLLAEVSKKNPNDPRTLLFLGGLRIDKGQFDEGIRDVQHAAQIMPQWALPQYFLGMAYLRENKRDLAQGALNSAAQLDPNFVAPRLILAQLELNQGKPEKAIATLESTVERKPRAVEPYLLRALALAQNGQYAEAEHDTLPLIDEFPQPASRAITYRTLAWAKFQQKRYDETVRLAKESLKYDSTSPEALYLLGASEIELNKPDVGLAEVQSYVNANPNVASGYEKLGQLQAMAHHLPDAERSVQKAIEIDPKLASAQFLLSDIEMAEGKTQEAMDVLLKLAQAEPQMAEVKVRLGQMSENKKDWGSAKSYYSKALELDPGNPVAENNLAWVYSEHDGNIDMALKLASDASRAFPENPEISDTLAWILLKKNDYDGAIRLLRISVGKDPQNPSYNYHMGVAYYHKGEKREAEKSLQTALKLELNPEDAKEARRILEDLSANKQAVR